METPGELDMSRICQEHHLDALVYRREMLQESTNLYPKCRGPADFPFKQFFDHQNVLAEVSFVSPTESSSFSGQPLKPLWTFQSGNKGVFPIQRSDVRTVSKYEEQQAMTQSYNMFQGEKHSVLKVLQSIDR